MRTRPGVSLVEVLVAATLLAVGIGGTLQSLLLSAQLRHSADLREAAAGYALDRLAWFEARACVQADTAAVEPKAPGIELRWQLRATDVERRLLLEVHTDLKPPRAPIRLHAEARCE
ncbi:MAG: prepilin-type N-terminal cleavage/methylation domain-containing protein [Gemmatimonadaceae bacterium]|nr:prepilin-type N-terminal cleavage/methylation domain-containing protein [Gemmatimonadaceae bacterium]MCW5826697.1 prepilin-type N-terminal cleavage/methylation domain-containing protein [Gemmatimonadaceae bacterium]